MNADHIRYGQLIVLTDQTDRVEFFRNAEKLRTALDAQGRHCVTILGIAEGCSVLIMSPEELENAW